MNRALCVAVASVVPTTASQSAAAGWLVRLSVKQPQRRPQRRGDMLAEVGMQLEDDDRRARERNGEHLGQRDGAPAGWEMKIAVAEDEALLEDTVQVGGSGNFGTESNEQSLVEHRRQSFADTGPAGDPCLIAIGAAVKRVRVPLGCRGPEKRDLHEVDRLPCSRTAFRQFACHSDSAGVNGRSG